MMSSKNSANEEVREANNNNNNATSAENGFVTKKADAGVRHEEPPPQVKKAELRKTPRIVRITGQQLNARRLEYRFFHEASPRVTRLYRAPPNIKSMTPAGRRRYHLQTPRTCPSFGQVRERERRYNNREYELKTRIQGSHLKEAQEQRMLRNKNHEDLLSLERQRKKLRIERERIERERMKLFRELEDAKEAENKLFKEREKMENERDRIEIEKDKMEKERIKIERERAKANEQREELERAKLKIQELSRRLLNRTVTEGKGNSNNDYSHDRHHSSTATGRYEGSRRAEYFPIKQEERSSQRMDKYCHNSRFDRRSSHNSVNSNSVNTIRDYCPDLNRGPSRNVINAKIERSEHRISKNESRSEPRKGSQRNHYYGENRSSNNMQDPPIWSGSGTPTSTGVEYGSLYRAKAMILPPLPPIKTQLHSGYANWQQAPSSSIKKAEVPAGSRSDLILQRPAPPSSPYSSISSASSPASDFKIFGFGVSGEYGSCIIDSLQRSRQY